MKKLISLFVVLVVSGVLALPDVSILPSFLMTLSAETSTEASMPPAPWGFKKCRQEKIDELVERANNLAGKLAEADREMAKCDTVPLPPECLQLKRQIAKLQRNLKATRVKLLDCGVPYSPPGGDYPTV